MIWIGVGIVALGMGYAGVQGETWIAIFMVSICAMIASLGC